MGKQWRVIRNRGWDENGTRNSGWDEACETGYGIEDTTRAWDEEYGMVSDMDDGMRNEGFVVSIALDCQCREHSWRSFF